MSETTETRPGTDPARIAAICDFMARAGALKDTLRSGNTPGGAPESTAAHSWSLGLLALLSLPHLPGIDPLRLLKLCLVHDLGEAISGDIPAIHQRAEDDKSARERADLATLCDGLPDDLRDEISALWEEYETGETAEARAAKGLDKCETMLSHVAGAQAPGFDYLWNLGHGRRWTDAQPWTTALRAEIDTRTRAAAEAGA